MLLQARDIDFCSEPKKNEVIARRAHFLPHMYTQKSLKKPARKLLYNRLLLTRSIQSTAYTSLTEACQEITEVNAHIHVKCDAFGVQEKKMAERKTTTRKVKHCFRCE